MSKISDDRAIPDYKTMHNKICKIALGVDSKLSNLAVKGKLGRFPLHIAIYYITFSNTFESN